MSLPRLIDLNISQTDPLKLAPFYRELRQPQSDWMEVTVLPLEAKRMDLLAYRVYGDGDLRYVLSVILGLDNQLDAVRPGPVVQVPPEHWLRERIRFWQSFWEGK